MKLSAFRRPLSALLVLVLAGCGPSAKQLADQQARADFRKTVAALELCAKGSTYQDFHEKRMALETCYTANQSMWNANPHYQRLAAIMDATDLLWSYENNGYTITTQQSENFLQTVDDTLAGISQFYNAVPAVTAVQAVEREAAVARDQLDSLVIVRSNFMQSANFNAGNPECLAVYRALAERIAKTQYNYDASATSKHTIPNSTTIPLPGGKSQSEWTTPLWNSMLVINPAIESKSGFTFEQRQADQDFAALSYVRWGLTLTSQECDALLAEK
jgi:hypothetical protein